jgi:hypothetical protein
MMTTFTQEPRKDEMPEPASFATLLKRWVLGLFVACILAVGGYALLTKSDETPLRAGRYRLWPRRRIPATSASI